LGTNYEKIKDTCIFAEKNGYDGFFYGESLANIDLDCWTVLSSLINITSKIKLGPVITYLFPEYRSIALLAKQAITFQTLSTGRLEYRTGAGATLQYSVQCDIRMELSIHYLLYSYFIQSQKIELHIVFLRDNNC